VIEYAATCDESIIEDVFHLPPDLEDTLDPFMSLAEPNSGSTDNHSKEPSVEVAIPEEASNVVSGDDEELMEIETAATLDDYVEPLSQHQTSPRKPNVLSSIDTTWTLDVDIDDYLVPPPMSKTDVNFTSTAVSPSIRTTWTLDVDDYLVPQPSSQADFNFPAAYTPFTLPIGSTDGDIVVEVAPIPAPSSPSRSWTVIKQGPVLSARQPGAQGQCSWVANKRGTSLTQRNSEGHNSFPGLATRHPCAQSQDQTVTCKGGRRVPQSNAERCTTYRMRQRAKKEKEDEELRTLFEQNRMLKEKEAVLRNNLSKIKAALLKIGLGGYFC